MRTYKKILCIALIFIFFFAGMPVQNFGIPDVYGAGITPDSDISYNDFANTDNLQLNGSPQIENNAIRFNDGVGSGQSVFTANKVSLGESLSFSTAFTFRNISPSTPIATTQGGFIFTLQSVDNSVVTSDFQHDSITPSLSIAFTADYMNAGPTARTINPYKKLYLASLTDFKPSEMMLAMQPPTRCEISAVSYYGGKFYDPISHLFINQYNVEDETSDYYHVWLGYDGDEKSLQILCQNPAGGYTYSNAYIDLDETTLPREVYSGFMGSLGNAGNYSEIGSWHFKNDLSIMDQAIVDADQAILNDYMEVVLGEPFNYSLSSHGQYGSTIRWTSSNIDIVAEDGTVYPPSLEQGNQTVTLTATLTKGSAVHATGPFTATIKARDSDIAAADAAWLTETLVLNGNTDLNNVLSDLNLAPLGKHGSEITWISTDTSVVNIYGKVIRPVFSDVDKEIILTAYINMNGVTEEKTFNVTVKKLGISDGEIVDADAAWLTNSQILGGNNSLDQISKKLILPDIGQYGSSIVWTSSDSDIVATDGTVAMPELGQAAQTVTLTAKISKGEVTDEKIFTVTVRVSDEDVTAADAALLTEASILNGNTALNNIVTALNLPDIGDYGSDIYWVSGSPSIISTDGIVTRPVLGAGNAEVLLIASVLKGESTASLPFTFTVRAVGRSDQEMIDADVQWLTESQILNGNTALNNVLTDLELPVAGNHGSTISWHSDDSNLIDTSGKVTRPTFIQGDKTIALTATISAGTGTVETETFSITVKAYDLADEEKVNRDHEWLKEAVILKNNTTLNSITEDLMLPISGDSGSTISWESSDTSLIGATGTVTRPSYVEGDKTVTLTATINMGIASAKIKIFQVVVKALEEKDEDKVNVDFDLLTDSIILNGNPALNLVTGDLKLPTIGENGSSITWASTDTEIVTINGAVKRPLFTQGPRTVTLTATISKGSFIKTKTFTITVIANTLITDQEMVELGYNWLTEGQILNGNSSLDNVLWNLNLPAIGKGGPYGTNSSNISWTSSGQGFVTIAGNVYRPMFHVGDQTVTLTATISHGSVSIKKTFIVIVKCLDLTNKESVDETAKWLQRYNILEENLSASSVVKNLSWPVSGQYGSTITWESGDTSLISDNGVVTRPENKRGNRRVNVTATISKDGEQLILPFQYIVLEQPDTVAPVVITSTPVNNAAGVLWDTDRITIT